MPAVDGYKDLIREASSGRDSDNRPVLLALQDRIDELEKELSEINKATTSEDKATRNVLFTWWEKYFPDRPFPAGLHDAAYELLHEVEDAGSRVAVARIRELEGECRRLRMSSKFASDEKPNQELHALVEWDKIPDWMGDYVAWIPFGDSCVPAIWRVHPTIEELRHTRHLRPYAYLPLTVAKELPPGLDWTCSCIARPGR